jgi:hypothetical protein
MKLYVSYTTDYWVFSDNLSTEDVDEISGSHDGEYGGDLSSAILRHVDS